MQGIFPFKEAKKDEYFYSLILNGQLDKYWDKVGGGSLSPEFKDLILRIFSFDGSKRPTLEQIREHPWLQKPFNQKTVRQSLADKLQENRSQKTAASSRDDKGNSRGEFMEEYIREQLALDANYKFNDMADFDVDVSPALIWEELNTFNVDCYDSKLKLTANPEKRCLFIESDGEEPFLVKAKFYALDPEACEGQEGRLRLKFVKKRGSIVAWYEALKAMKEIMHDLLLAPISHQKETVMVEETA